jgi:hypothetical protein
MTEPVPSTAHGLLVAFDFSFVKEIVDVPRLRSATNVERHPQISGQRVGLEVAKGDR